MRQKKKLLIAGLALALLAGGCALSRQTEGGQADTAAADSPPAEEAVPEGIVSYGGRTYRYKETVKNYLFLGIDKPVQEGEEQTSGTAGQADTIILLSRDSAEGSLKALMIPRDTMAEVELFDVQGRSLGTTRAQINLQYAYGDGRGSSCRLMKEAVSGLLYQTPVDGYCALQMDGIAVLNDAVGGVTVTVPEGGFSAGGQAYAAGTELLLDGTLAEAFVRYRDTGKAFSSLERMENQEAYLAAWLQKAGEAAEAAPGFVTGLYMDLQPYLVTDLGNELFAELLQEAQAGSAEARTLPGSGQQGESFDEYHADEEALYQTVLELFYEEVE